MIADKQCSQLANLQNMQQQVDFVCKASHHWAGNRVHIRIGFISVHHAKHCQNHKKKKKKLTSNFRGSNLFFLFAVSD